MEPRTGWIGKGISIREIPMTVKLVLGLGGILAILAGGTLGPA